MAFWGSTTRKYTTAFTLTLTLSDVITSCVGTSITIVRRLTRTMRSMGQKTQIKPGPLGSASSRPMRKMTPRSYSRSTFSELKNQMRIIPKGTRNIAMLFTVSSMVQLLLDVSKIVPTSADKNCSQLHTTVNICGCEERNELHEKLALATISYVGQVRKVMAAALLSDPSQFVQARQEEREPERLYRQASDAFLRHREETSDRTLPSLTLASSKTVARFGYI